MDCGLSILTEAVVSSIIRPSQPLATWSESEATTDWILSDSAVAKTLKDIDSALTITGTRSLISTNLQVKSDAFLAKIGAPQITLEAIKNIKVDDFTLKEKELWTKFLARPNQVVSFDEIEPDADKFSLYAIAKTVQRLRDKMETSGVTGSLIQSKRGEGYILVS